MTDWMNLLRICLLIVFVVFCFRLQLTPDCIQIHRNNDGRPSGEAVVNFHNRAEAERAIAEKNRQNIGTRYIELFMT